MSATSGLPLSLLSRHPVGMLAVMRLAELAAGVPGAVVEAGGDAEITAIAYDSRKAGPGTLFVAVEGIKVDGHSFAAEVAARGAALAVQRTVRVPENTPLVRMASTRTGLAELAATFHARPARKLRVVGVTGTDGKTTTTHMAAHVLETCGIASGALSTVSFKAGAETTFNETGQTTIESLELQAWLARMVDLGVRDVVVETTSHALIQERVAACDFDVAAFTNVGRDHLDYHANWEDYLAAKARLIDACAGGAPKGIPKTAILNLDDASYEHLLARPIERRLTYSMLHEADLVALDVHAEVGSSSYRLIAFGQEATVHLQLPARFNVYNSLCAAGIALALGCELEAVAAGLSSFHGVPGRLERVEGGQPFSVYVDFAHSAGALTSALAELRSLTAGRLLVVFGSTGRSDHDRPGMGLAAAAGSDYFIITTDDPVDEDPAEIARQVAEGAHGMTPGRDYDIVLDRRAAIRQAMAMAHPGDVILLAGKGHERTMLTARGKEAWDEAAEAEAAIREVLGL